MVEGIAVIALLTRQETVFGHLKIDHPVPAEFGLAAPRAAVVRVRIPIVAFLAARQNTIPTSRRRAVPAIPRVIITAVSVRGVPVLALFAGCIEDPVTALLADLRNADRGAPVAILIVSVVTFLALCRHHAITT